MPKVERFIYSTTLKISYPGIYLRGHLGVPFYQQGYYQFWFEFSQISRDFADLE